MDAVMQYRVPARDFTLLPGADEALALLDEVNRYAPAAGPVSIGGKDLWLYGAGNLGKLAQEHLTVVGQPIAGIVDRDAERHSSANAWNAIPVLNPDCVPAQVKAEALLAVSVVTTPFAPLRDALMADGWVHVVPFYDVAEAFREHHPLSNGWFAQPLDRQAMVLAGSVLRGFADDISRAHYLRFAAWRLARQEWHFPQAPVTTDDRFFIPEIRDAIRPGDPDHGERVLDAGAHHGDLVPRFAEILGGRFARYWAIEPDPQSLARLRTVHAVLPREVRERTEVIDAVLAEANAPARFHASLGYASQIAQSGAITRQSTRIDRLDLDPTIFKLHLEGGELNTLKGAQSTIAAHRPILMLTIYHDVNGLIETPLWLFRTLKDYVILMRTHSFCGTGAVLYAIPQERR